MFGDGECGIVQLLISIGRGVGRADRFFQVRTERLYDREYDTSRRGEYRVSRYVVEYSVGIGSLVIVEPVEVHDL